MSSKLVLTLFVGLGLLVLFIPLPLSAAQPAERHWTLEARRFAFQPAVIQVSQGDRVILELESVDVTHSLYVDGYALEAVSEPGHKGRIEFVAERVGKFTYRCTMACGMLHPFMVGELIVRPNIPYWRAIALTLLATVGSVLYLRFSASRRNRVRSVAGPSRRIELTRSPFLKRLLQWRGFQPLLMLPTLLGFMLAVLTGLFGTPVGSRNFAIVFVWIVWFALLKILLVPFGGRLWCMMCPIPAPGEWLQRRGIIARSSQRPISLARKWPRQLEGLWLQNAGLLLVTTFSPIILTLPVATGIVLLAFLVIAIILSLVFERRVFCRYLCPVGGFIGVYSLMAPVELRVKDVKVCRQHREKECYLGNAKGYGCPWMVKPWELARNALCGLCTECLKTCPKDNIAINLRPFGSDLIRAGRSLGEAYNTLIMLTAAILFSVIFLGPWGWLKEWAGVSSLPNRVLYVFTFLGLNLLVVPGLFLLITVLSRRLSRQQDLSLKQLFVDHSYALVPLGLSLWIAFSITFLLVNGSYAVSVISDPFGWGWNLFGTRSSPWVPLVGMLPYLQLVIVLAGLIFSIYIAYLGEQHGTGDKPLRSLVPITAFLSVISLVFLRLYLG